MLLTVDHTNLRKSLFLLLQLISCSHLILFVYVLKCHIFVCFFATHTEMISPSRPIAWTSLLFIAQPPIRSLQLLALIGRLYDSSYTCKHYCNSPNHTLKAHIVEYLDKLSKCDNTCSWKHHSSILQRLLQIHQNASPFGTW